MNVPKVSKAGKEMARFLQVNNFLCSKNFWIFHSQKKSLEQLVVPADESELLLNGRKEMMRRGEKKIDREKT